MYSNIGGKIKGLAVAFCILGVIASVIGGLVQVSSGEDELVAMGFLTMILGSLLFWILSWTLYGFGELITKVTEIERNTRGGSSRGGSFVGSTGSGFTGSFAKPDISEATGTYAYANADPARAEYLNKLRAQGLITEEEYQQAIHKG